MTIYSLSPLLVVVIVAASNAIEIKKQFACLRAISRQRICDSPQTGQIFFVLLRRLSVLQKQTRLQAGSNKAFEERYARKISKIFQSLLAKAQMSA